MRVERKVVLLVSTIVLMTAGMTLLSVQVLLQVISAFSPQASDL